MSHPHTPQPLFTIVTDARGPFREHRQSGCTQARVDEYLSRSKGADPMPRAEPCGLLTTIRQAVDPRIVAKADFCDSWLDEPVHMVVGGAPHTLCGGRVIVAFYQFVNGDSHLCTRRPAYLVHDTSFGVDEIRLVQSA